MTSGRPLLQVSELDSEKNLVRFEVIMASSGTIVIR